MTQSSGDNLRPEFMQITLAGILPLTRGAVDSFWRRYSRPSLLGTSHSMCLHALVFFCTAVTAFAEPAHPPLSPTTIFAPVSTPAQSIVDLSFLVLMVTAAIFIRKFLWNLEMSKKVLPTQIWFARTLSSTKATRTCRWSNTPPSVISIRTTS